MKKGRFLWFAHRITERQKAGKARNIKGKQLKNSRSTVLKVLVELHSSQNVNFWEYSKQFKETQIDKSLYLSAKTRFEFFCLNKVNMVINA